MALPAKPTEGILRKASSVMTDRPVRQSTTSLPLPIQPRGDEVTDQASKQSWQKLTARSAGRGQPAALLLRKHRNFNALLQGVRHQTAVLSKCLLCDGDPASLCFSCLRNHTLDHNENAARACTDGLSRQCEVGFQQCGRENGRSSPQCRHRLVEPSVERGRA